MAQAQRVSEEMAEAKVRADAVTYTTLLNGWVQQGDMAQAQRVLEVISLSLSLSVCLSFFLFVCVVFYCTPATRT